MRLTLDESRDWF